MALEKFVLGTEVFCKSNISMSGNIRSVFQRLNGEIWCVFESPGGLLYICPQDNLIPNRGTAHFGASPSLKDYRRTHDQT